MKKLIIILFLCFITVTSCRRIGCEYYEIEHYVVFVNETDHTITLYNTSPNSISYPDFTLTGSSTFTIESRKSNLGSALVSPRESEVIIDEETSVQFEYKSDDRDPYNPCLDRNFEQVFPTKYIEIRTFTFTEKAIEYYINLAKEQQGEEELGE